MVLRSFEEVRALRGKELHRLFAEGDGRERVWAAWAIGLALGAESLPTLLGELDRDPSAGVRCHLVVMLAGLQQADLLATLALEDPAEEVRASALTYLIRIGRADRAALLFDRLAEDPSAAVRLVVATHCSDPARFFADPSAAVCEAALDRLALSELPRELEARVATESDATLRRRLLRLIGATGRVPPELACAEERAVLDALEIWEQLGLTLDWPALEPWARRGVPAIDARIFKVLDPDSSSVDWAWVLACADREGAHELQDSLRSAYAANGFAWRALETREFGTLDPSLAELCRRRIDRLSQSLVPCDGDDEEEAVWAEEAEQERARLETLLHSGPRR
jgi:hypothetical protein